jgi:hypothetical protein
MTTPNQFKGGPDQMVLGVVALGTGAVSTQTRIVGVVPQDLVVKGIRYYGQAAVTGTTVTAEAHARTAAGAAGASLQSAATDINFASAAAGKAGVAAALTTTTGDRRLAQGQLLEVVVTATSITAGPGDLLVAVEFEPRS